MNYKNCKIKSLQDNKTVEQLTKAYKLKVIYDL